MNTNDLPSMNPDIKARWVAALRSGDYAQTRYRLRNEHGFCCIGVLCDLHSQQTQQAWGIIPHAPMDNIIPLSCDYLGSIAGLPADVLAWSGIANHGISTALAQKNDGIIVPAHDFNAIADWIEENL